MMLGKLSFVVAVCCAVNFTHAQVTPIAPFIGELSDPFDFPTYPGTAHLTFDIFGGAVQLQAPVETPEYNQGAIKIEIDSTLNGVLVSAHTGIYEISFLFDDGDTRPGVFFFNDDDVHRFGGYFANNSPTDDAMIEMFDASGAKMGSFLISVPSGGSWTWHGWHSVDPIKWITIRGFSPPPYSGGFIWFDDLEMSTVPPPSGACCQGNRDCQIMTETECAELAGWTFVVGRTSCADGDGNGTADVCEEPVEVCVADCATTSTDNEVNIVDLLELLSRWGPGSTCDIAPTPNGDGTIDILDLLELISAWGTCP